MRTVVCTASRRGTSQDKRNSLLRVGWGWRWGSRTGKGAGPGPSFGHLSSGAKGKGCLSAQPSCGPSQCRRARATCHADFRTGVAPGSLCRAAGPWPWPGEDRVCRIQPDTAGYHFVFYRLLPGQAWASRLTFLSLVVSLSRTEAKDASLIKDWSQSLARRRPRSMLVFTLWVK